MKHLYTTLKVALVALFAMMGTHVMADEVLKVDFSELTPITEPGICTCDYDMEKNKTTLSQMQEINGWFMAVENGNNRAGGIFAYGSDNWLGGTGFVAPATDPDGKAEGNALGVVAVWTSSVCYQRSATLPAGNYTMKIRIYNSVGGSSVPKKSLFGFVTEGGVEYLAGAKAYAVGQWTTEEISFTLDKETNGEISLGYEAQNVGSANAQHLFIHDIVIEAVTETDILRQDLKVLIDQANKMMENTDKVGEGLFMIPQEAYNEFHAAIYRCQSTYNDETATKDELQTAISNAKAAIAAYQDATTKPSGVMAYTIKQKASGLYMALTGEGDDALVVLSEKPYQLKFERTEGGFYLTDGTRYVGVAGTNAWSMSAAPDKKAIVNGTNLGNGEYTFEITGYRSIGSDDPADGAQLWADKYVGREGYDSDRCIWALEEVVPEGVFTINVKREAGKGYGVTTYEPDFTDALHYLGISKATDAVLVGVNPDGSEEANPGPGDGTIDGWCNAEGFFCGWGKPETKICVKFFPSVPQYEICDMNGADEVGKSYTVCYGLKANDKMAIFAIKVLFVAQDYKTFPIVKTIDIQHEEMANTAYSQAEPAPRFDVNEVCQALGVEDLMSVETYIVNVTDGNFVENNTDGWRDGNGDASPWTPDRHHYFCVKLNDPASGEFDYTGAYDDSFNIGDTYLAQWAIVANEKAVLLKVNVTFVDPTGINDITVNEQVREVYNLNGMRMKNGAQQKGIYIVNGKKLVVK